MIPCVGVRYSVISLLLTAAVIASNFRVGICARETPQLVRTPEQRTCLHSIFRETPAQVPGPFYMHAPVRRNITEGRPGVPFKLTLFVKDKTCRPFPAGTKVEIWHCDFHGVYSGFKVDPNGKYEVDTEGQTFLRGTQMTDENGKVVFATIFPGWYTSRTVHIHLKVMYNAGHGELITQLYFNSSTVREVFELDGYRDRGLPDTTNKNDSIVGNDPTALNALMLDVKRESPGRYIATYNIGIDTVAHRHEAQYRTCG